MLCNNHCQICTQHLYFIWIYRQFTSSPMSHEVHKHLMAAHTNKSALGISGNFQNFLSFSVFLNLCLPPVSDNHIIVQFLECNNLSHTFILDHF